MDAETQQRVDEISAYLEEALKPFIGEYKVTPSTIDLMTQTIFDSLPPVPEHDWNVQVSPVEGSPTELTISFTPPAWMVHYPDENNSPADHGVQDNP